MNLKFDARVFRLALVIVAVSWVAWDITSTVSAAPPEQNMNDRIIAETAKCVSNGMEAVVTEARYSAFPSGDVYFVVCKTPQPSNLERLARQMGEQTEKEQVKRFKAANPESFETKSKVTQ